MSKKLRLIKDFLEIFFVLSKKDRASRLGKFWFDLKSTEREIWIDDILDDLGL